MAEENDSSWTQQPSAWADVDTFFVDGLIGSSHWHGLHRLLLGSVTYNTEQGASAPAFKPVCELVVSLDVLRQIVSHFEELEKAKNDA